MFQYPNSALNLQGQSPVQRWAVLVGVNNYLEKSVKSDFCVNNAQAFHHFLIAQSAYGYAPDRSRLLLSRPGGTAEATRRGVLQALEETARQLQATDLLLFYFSGPAVCLNGEACLLPADARLDPDSCLPAADTVIPAQRIKTIFRETGAQAKAIILDVWYSDGLDEKGQSARRGGESDFVRSIFQDASDLPILMALAHHRTAPELQNSDTGIFTAFLLNALGMIESRDGVGSVATVKDVHTEVARQMDRNGIGRDRLILEYGGRGETALLAQPRLVSPAPGASLWPPDLGPVTERKDFYNRAAELEDIRRVLKTAVQAGKAIIVRGERCIGKTSLINRTRQLLTEEIWPGQRYVGLNIAPNSITSCADFAGELWMGLKVRLKQLGDSSAELGAPFKFDTVTRFVTQLERCQADCADTTVVVFIDEFDHIMHQCTELETQKIIGLIRYLVEATNLPLVFFIVMLRDLPTGHGSPFPHAKVLLHPLKQADFYELAAGLLKNWGTIPLQTLAWLYDFTNGHPYFIRLVLNYLAPAPEKWIEAKAVQSAAQLAMAGDYAHEILGDIYRNYLNNDERYIWLWLAQYGGELPAAEVKEAAAALRGVFKRLERRDFIALTPAGGYRLPPYLYAWLVEWPEFAAEAERLEVPGPPPAVSRPATLPAEVNAPPEEPVAGVCIDRQSKRVYQAGQEISDLPPGGLEYRALVYLAERAGQVVSKDDLAKYVWQQDYYQEDDQRISAVIYRLRRTYGVRSLQTLRKAGYRLPQATLI